MGRGAPPRTPQTGSFVEPTKAGGWARLAAGELLGWAYGAADSSRGAAGRLAPSGDVLERRCQAEKLERLVEYDPQAGPRQAKQVVRSEARGGVKDSPVQTGEVPPLGRNFAWRSRRVPPPESASVMGDAAYCSPALHPTA